MPLTRSRVSPGTAFLSLVLCLALAGCGDDFFPIDTVDPKPVTLQDWLGEYDGTATAQVYETGSVYTDVAGHLSVERAGQETLGMSFSVAVSPLPDDLENIGDFTGGHFDTAGVGWRLIVPMEEVIPKTTLSVTYVSGIRRNRLSLTRSGYLLTCLLYVDSQGTDGSYEVVGEIEVYLTKQP
jgi:hypothetical protein